MLLISLTAILVSLVSLVNASKTYNFIYTTDSKSEFVYLSVDDSSDLEEAIVNCSTISDQSIVNKVLALTLTLDPVITIDEDSFNSLVKSCKKINENRMSTETTEATGTTEESSSILGLASDLLIAPGTKWCGPGDRASEYDDLGVRAETDACCRDHDNCPMSIGAFETKYNLTNTQVYTSSRCDCDEQLKSCLQKSSDVEATLFGVIYFNILKTKCFREVEQKGQCLEYSGLLIKECTKYADPDSTEPVYQFQTSGLFI